MVKRVIVAIVVLLALISIKPIQNWRHQKWLVNQENEAKAAALEVAKALLTGDIEKVKSFAPEEANLETSPEDIAIFSQLQSEENPFKSPEARFEVVELSLSEDGQLAEAIVRAIMPPKYWQLQLRRWWGQTPGIIKGVQWQEILIFEKGRWRLQDLGNDQLIYSSTAPDPERAAKWGLLLWAQGVDHLLAPGTKIERDKSRDYFYQKYDQPLPGFYERDFVLQLPYKLEIDEVKNNLVKLSYQRKGVYDYGIDQFDGKFDIGTLIARIEIETEFFKDGWWIKKGRWWFEFEPY